MSDRRVRQLAADGTLEVTSTKPLRVSMEAVHKERDRRRSTEETSPISASGLLTADQVVDLAAKLVASVSAREIEAVESRFQLQLKLQQTQADQVETALKAALAESKAEADMLRSQLQAKASSAVPGPRRWFRRS
jgi:hypothetical protein